MRIERVTNPLCLIVLSLLVLTMGCDFAQEILMSPNPVEQKPWLGEWQIVTIDGQTLAELFADESRGEAVSGYSSVWFYDDETWSGSVEMTFSQGSFYLGFFVGFSGTYTLSDNVFTLSTDDDEIFSDEGGTWEIEGDTLTLRFYNEGDIVLQRGIYYDIESDYHDIESDAEEGGTAAEKQQ